MPEALPPPRPDTPSALAQQLFRKAASAHPLSRFLQGAEIALACHEQGVDPKKLEKDLLKDKLRMTSFLEEINADHEKNNIRRIRYPELERSVRMVLGGWAKRLMLLNKDELREVIEKGISLHGKEAVEIYADEVSLEVQQRANSSRRFMRPKRKP
jgi:hypothetical protein